MNRRARQGACCLFSLSPHLVHHPSLCSVPLLVVQAFRKRRTDPPPLGSGPRRGRRGPQRVFVRVLSSQASVSHARPAQCIRHPGCVPVETKLSQQQGAGPSNYPQNPRNRTFPSSSPSSSCFRGTQPKSARCQRQHGHGMCVVSSDRALCTYMHRCILVSSGISIIDPRPNCCPSNKARADSTTLYLYCSFHI